MPVPLAKASLTVPYWNLLDLPQDAAFTQKDGRANIRLQRQGDTIHIEATCDSLQGLVEYYERQERARTRSDTLTETAVVEEHSTGLQNPLKWFFYGFLTGIITILFIKIKK